MLAAARGRQRAERDAAERRAVRVARQQQLAGGRRVAAGQASAARGQSPGSRDRPRATRRRRGTARPRRRGPRPSGRAGWRSWRATWARIASGGTGNATMRDRQNAAFRREPHLRPNRARGCGHGLFWYPRLIVGTRLLARSESLHGALHRNGGPAGVVHRGAHPADRGVEAGEDRLADQEVADVELASPRGARRSGATLSKVRPWPAWTSRPRPWAKAAISVSRASSRVASAVSPARPASQ